MYLRDNESGELLKAEITELPSSKNKSTFSEFGFNWLKLSKKTNSKIYCIKLKRPKSKVLGLMHLTEVNGMLVMNLLEISRKNIGKLKKLDYVAGCLIAFACLKSFKIENSYKGFLTFNAKSELTELYKSKYYANQINDQRMYINPKSGVKLIDEYLYRKHDK